jgi:hypothetical protein
MLVCSLHSIQISMSYSCYSMIIYVNGRSVVFWLFQYGLNFFFPSRRQRYKSIKSLTFSLWHRSTTKEIEKHFMRLKSPKNLHCIRSTQVIKKIFIVWAAANLTYKRIYFGLLFVARNFSRFTIQHEGHFSHFFLAESWIASRRVGLFLNTLRRKKKNFHLMSLFISLISSMGVSTSDVKQFCRDSIDIWHQCRLNFQTMPFAPCQKANQP